MARFGQAEAHGLGQGLPQLLHIGSGGEPTGQLEGPDLFARLVVDADSAALGPRRRRGRDDLDQALTGQHPDRPARGQPRDLVPHGLALRRHQAAGTGRPIGISPFGSGLNSAYVDEMVDSVGP